MGIADFTNPLMFLLASEIANTSFKIGIPISNSFPNFNNNEYFNNAKSI